MALTINICRQLQNRKKEEENHDSMLPGKIQMRTLAEMMPSPLVNETLAKGVKALTIHVTRVRKNRKQMGKEAFGNQGCWNTHKK